MKKTIRTVELTWETGTFVAVRRRRDVTPRPYDYGGQQATSDETPALNPDDNREHEFIEIVEGKK